MGMKMISARGSKLDNTSFGDAVSGHCGGLRGQVVVDLIVC
jgi:hypothetical protein